MMIHLNFVIHLSNTLVLVYNYVKDFFVAINPGITPVPVRFIATKEASDWDIAICIIGSSN